MGSNESEHPIATRLHPSSHKNGDARWNDISQRIKVNSNLEKKGSSNSRPYLSNIRMSLPGIKVNWVVVLLGSMSLIPKAFRLAGLHLADCRIGKRPK